MTTDDDKDILAAEYVLGTLDADDRANAQMLLAIDPGFAAVVTRWERTLGELHGLVESVEPPKATWEWIQARIAGSAPSGKVWLPDAAALAAAADAPKPAPSITDAEAKAAAAVVEQPKEPDAETIADRGRMRRWRSRALLLGTLAAGLVAVVVAREMRPDLMPEALKPPTVVVEKPVEVVRIVEVPSQQMAEFVAVFQKDDDAPQFLLTVDEERKTVSVRKVGATLPPEKSYELWILPAGAPAPRSLGLLDDGEYTVRRALADYDGPTIGRATFGISLEPAGGSPTGTPTGSMLQGRLLQTAPQGFPAASP